MSPGALTVSEAAELLGISRATAYRLVESGDLPAKRFRGAVRVSLPFLEAFLASPCETLAEYRVKQLDSAGQAR
jgi:excisionase family DNA binding protein